MKKGPTPSHSHQSTQWSWLGLTLFFYLEQGKSQALVSVLTGLNHVFLIAKFYLAVSLLQKLLACCIIASCPRGPLLSLNLSEVEVTKESKGGRPCGLGSHNYVFTSSLLGKNFLETDLFESLAPCDKGLNDIHTLEMCSPFWPFTLCLPHGPSVSDNAS